jgi:hypothetical protein
MVTHIRADARQRTPDDEKLTTDRGLLTMDRTSFVQAGIP